MSYKLKLGSNIPPSQVVLAKSRLGSRIIVGICLSIGLLALLPGVLMLLTGDTSVGALTATGIGLVFIAGAGVVVLAGRVPERFVFDNDQGALLIEEKGAKGKRTTTPLPYADIEGFGVREHRSSGGDGGSVHYVVELLKRDGAFWSLAAFQREKSAKELHSHIVQHVDLSRSASAEPVSLPSAIEVIEHSDRTLVRWRKELHPGKMLLLFMMLVGFALMFVAFRSEMQETGLYLGASILGLLTAVAVYSVFSLAGAFQVVEITPERVRIYQTGGLFKGRRQDLAATDIDAILFNFSLFGNDSVIYLLRAQERDLLQRIKRGDVGLGDVGSALELMLRVPKITALGLSVGDLLKLELLLQQRIHQRTDHRPE